MWLLGQTTQTHRKLYWDFRLVFALIANFGRGARLVVTTYDYTQNKDSQPADDEISVPSRQVPCMSRDDVGGMRGGGGRSVKI